MAARLTYVIKFVADMDAAIAVHRDHLGLPVKFATPFWTEMATGEMTLALHPATPDKPAGHVEVGLGSTISRPSTPRNRLQASRSWSRRASRTA